MGVKAGEMIKVLMGMGVMATVNQTIDFDTASLVAAEFNYELEKATFEEEALLKVQEDEPGKLEGRPPVVTIMGHVDHGKTSLLDVIRKTRVTQGEAGGITQHIGAYQVETDKGQVVFLDTPGHEAFTAMRSRGASVTDIVVLVVAADDGVMPQTVEAINHARAAGVPIIVAINKIDKANAEPERVQRELAEAGLTPEDWGGDTIFVKVSAKQNQGIDDLLEMIMLQAEILELKANPDKLAFGHVVEAKLDSGRGAVATVLIEEGTLHTGDPVVCGVHYGKVRSLINDLGERIESAGPAMPVEILGLSGVPQAGDELIALKDEKDAKQVSEHRLQKQRSKELAKTSRMSLDKLFEKMGEGDVKDLNIILKADVHGSIEALRDSLTKLSNEEVRINIVHAATGTITESDVSLAAVSDAIIIGFNVRPSPKVQTLANDENIDMRYYKVIYNVIKDVKDAIVGMMSSTFEEQVLGQAEVREVFHVPKVGAIAGCYVTDGKIERGRPVRLVRDGVVSYEGKIASLRRFKDDVKEVQSGYECGIGIENYNDIKVGDVIECYYMEEIKPELKE
jgi:translation initiation factor IF-2